MNLTERHKRKTFDLYMAADESMELLLCDSCKHNEVDSKKEPCKSCCISNWEKMEEKEGLM